MDAAIIRRGRCATTSGQGESQRQGGEQVEEAHVRVSGKEETGETQTESLSLAPVRVSLSVSAPFIGRPPAQVEPFGKHGMFEILRR